MSGKWIILSSALVGGAACAAAAVWFCKRRRYNAAANFVLIGEVSQLNVYPVNSLRAVNVKEMDCRGSGARHKELRDKQFMLVDSDTGKLVTGRQFPKLLTISADLYDNTLFLTSRGRTFELNLEEVVRRNDIRGVELHDGLKQEGLDCGNQISEFLRLILEVTNNLRLLYRIQNAPPDDELSKPKQPVITSDDCPYLMLCESSLGDLNSRLSPEDQVDMRYFRPVVAITGPPAYDEEKWAKLKIGDVTFVCKKPYQRCIMTTIDPDTGIRRTNNQPLKLLREYRLPSCQSKQFCCQNPIFGICAGVSSEGTIRIGDPVYAQYKGKYH